MYLQTRPWDNSHTVPKKRRRKHDTGGGDELAAENTGKIQKRQDTKRGYQMKITLLDNIIKGRPTWLREQEAEDDNQRSGWTM